MNLHDSKGCVRTGWGIEGNPMVNLVQERFMFQGSGPETSGLGMSLEITVPNVRRSTNPSRSFVKVESRLSFEETPSPIFGFCVVELGYNLTFEKDDSMLSLHGLECTIPSLRSHCAFALETVLHAITKGMKDGEFIVW